MLKNFFTNNILLWNNTENQRKMPWKGIANPYYIWLSEIMLQQTRVAQATAYYNKFITTFPTINDLALANDELVLKMWEGLGYYSRCRNMLYTARQIVYEYKGVFPNNYFEILKLKGIGNYTAAAIASFAYGLPYAVVDGNVFRILSRFTGNDLPIDTNEGKLYFSNLAQQLLDKQNVKQYNQAIMDFGATVCTPKNPDCTNCVLQKKCVAYSLGKTNLFPVKLKKVKQSTRYFVYVVLKNKTKIAVQKRVEKDIWKDFYEFLLIETDEIQFCESIFLQKMIKEKYNLEINLTDIKASLLQQKLTHRTIKAGFYEIELEKPIKIKNMDWVNNTKLNELPFAGIINQYFETRK
jgi:A/G-specific adenine glycosylase